MTSFKKMSSLLLSIMPQEIERKFLVLDESFKSDITPVYVRQGFISTDKDTTIRVRVAGDKAFLTLKNAGNGITRSEFEYEIPTADAEELLNTFCQPAIIEKNRYIVKHSNHNWEVDEFLGDNQVLIIAEIELQSEHEHFSIPSWLGEEVSKDPRYYNANLISNPYSNW